MPKPEIRNFTAELRAKKAADGSSKVCGRAIVFNQLSEDLGGFREKIAPGALKKTLAERNVKALNDHDSSMVIGSVKSGTLSVAVDENGLTFEATPPDAQWARDMMASIERGDVDACSFGFRTINDDWEVQTIDGEEEIVRTVVELELYEISCVAFAAYPQTSATLRDRFATDDAEAVKKAINLIRGNADESRRANPDDTTPPQNPAPDQRGDEHGAGRDDEALDLARRDRAMRLRAELAKED